MEIAAEASQGPVSPFRGSRTLSRAIEILIMLAVVATAFNDLYPLLPAGELSSEGFIYVFPLLILYFLRAPSTIAVPISLTLLTFALVAAIVLGITVNYGEIATAYFKGRSGVGRIATQGMSLGFGLIVALMFYNFTIRGFLPVIARGARAAVLVISAVGLLELASWYSIPLLTQAHEALSLVIHAGSDPYLQQRLRTTAFEASWAAVILTFLFPFAIAILSGKGWRILAYIVIAFIFVVLSHSRTALLVISFQIMLLAWMLFRRRIDLLVHALALGCLGALLLLLTPGIEQRVGDKLANLVEYGSINASGAVAAKGNISNVTRLAAIRAGLSMFRDRPLLGVGLGQYGFNYPAHLQAEDFRSWEVRDNVEDADEKWPPAYSTHVRLLAETGIIGYVSWIGLVVSLLLRSLRNADASSAVGRMHLAVTMTLAGWLLLGASIDSFRFFGGWIAIGVALGLPDRDISAQA